MDFFHNIRECLNNTVLTETERSLDIDYASVAPPTDSFVYRMHDNLLLYLEFSTHFKCKFAEWHNLVAIMVTALIYVARVASKYRVEKEDLRVLYVMCLILATKFHNDDCFDIRTFCACFKIDEKPVRRLEVNCIKMINYSLHVSVNEFEGKLTLLH